MNASMRADTSNTHSGLGLIRSWLTRSSNRTRPSASRRLKSAAAGHPALGTHGEPGHADRGPRGQLGRERDLGDVDAGRVQVVDVEALEQPFGHVEDAVVVGVVVGEQLERPAQPERVVAGGEVPLDAG